MKKFAVRWLTASKNEAGQQGQTLSARVPRYELVQLENDSRTKLHNLLLDFQVSAANVVAAKTSIKQAEENLRVTRLSYQEGLATGTDLLDAITSLSRPNFTYVDANRKVFANYFNIIRAVEGF